MSMRMIGTFSVEKSHGRTERKLSAGRSEPCKPCDPKPGQSSTHTAIEKRYLSMIL